MKKYTMIGINSIPRRSGKTYCCILKCLLPFEKIVKEDIEASDFFHSSTNWGGCDELQQTISIEKLRLTGRSICLENPIIFHGADYDHGHNYGWSFTVNEICETETE